MYARRDVLALSLMGFALAVAVLVLWRDGARPAPNHEPNVARPEPRDDRPVDAPPADPRRGPHPVRAAHPRPVDDGVAPPAAASSTIEVRVVDTRGKPRAGVPVEVREAELGGGAGRLVAGPATTNDAGRVEVPLRREDRGRELVAMVGLLLAEPALQPIVHGGGESTTVVTPDVGSLSVSLVDEQGGAYQGDADVCLLLGTNDPPLDPLQRQRLRVTAALGKARFTGVEAGALVLVEARPRDAHLVAAPRLVESPTGEGEDVQLSLILRPRPESAQAEDGAPVSPAPLMRPPELGPPSIAPPQPGTKPSLIVSLRPVELLPHWPLVLQVGASPAASAATAVDARVDSKGVAVMSAPPGSYGLSLRLYRAAPDGWRVVDIRPPEAGFGRVTFAADRTARLTVDLDADALAAAAAALTLP